MMAEDGSRTFQARRALLAQLAPRYQQASLAQKTLLLDAFVEWTGYTRKYAIELLNHGEPGQQTIQRHRLPQYGPAVQQALFLTWKAAHYVCAKRLLPSLPTLVTLLERHGHLCLTEEERRQLLTMSLSTAERYLRTQRKPRLHSLSTTTPGPWGTAQVPVCSFSPWEEHRPGFVEMDLVAHCGDHLDGDFLYTLTLTDLATGWTECVPLLSKSAEAVLSALAQARMLLPFPLVLSEQLDALRQTLVAGAHLPPVAAPDGLAWSPLNITLSAGIAGPPLACEQEPERTNYLEVPARSEERLHGPSTPHERFASLCEELLALIQAHPTWTGSQIMHAFVCLASTRTDAAPLGARRKGPGPCSPFESSIGENTCPPERTWEVSPASHFSETAIVEREWCPMQTPLMHVPPAYTSSRTSGEHGTGRESRITLEQAIATYLHTLRAQGRAPKTIEWHRTSLFALRQYLWRQFHLTDVSQLSRSFLQRWVTDLSSEPTTRTGARRTVSTVAAYVRSAHAFCNWLIQQGYLSAPLFLTEAVPHAQRRAPRLVEPEVFARLLSACELAGEPGGQHAGLAARNRAILWLLWDTGLQVAEVCRLRLADVDRAQGTVTVLGKAGDLRTFPLSADGQRAMCTYLEQVRLTPAWEPVVPEARDQLLLTERRHPLTKNSLTMLFKRLSQRAGFCRKPICPSMLRDTYAIRFLQAGGTVAALQEQLGVADRASVKRYQHFCEQQDQERGTQEYSEGALPPRHVRRSTCKRLQQRNK